MISNQPITLSTRDHTALSWKLGQLLSTHSRKRFNLQRLHEELSRAILLPPALVSSSTVQLGSKFIVKDLDSGEVDTFTLSWPEKADIAKGEISVFAPLGTAVIGFSKGDEITWQMPGGLRRLKLMDVQPPVSAASALSS